MKPIVQIPLLSLALAAALSAGMAVAQTSETPAAEAAPAGNDPIDDLSMGEPVDAEGNRLGEEYILETSGDWSVVCVRTPLEHDPCALRQLLQDDAGNSVSTVEIVNLPPGRQAAAGATIMTPLETLLTQQVTLSIDGGAGKRYPFTFCTQSGCVSRVGFTEGEIDAFRRGNAARLSIVPAAAPDQRVEVTMSLSGFTAGFARIGELNALNAEAITAAQAAQQQQQQQGGGNN